MLAIVYVSSMSAIRLALLEHYLVLILLISFGKLLSYEVGEFGNIITSCQMAVRGKHTDNELPSVSVYQIHPHVFGWPVSIVEDTYPRYHTMGLYLEPCHYTNILMYINYSVEK